MPTPTPAPTTTPPVDPPASPVYAPDDGDVYREVKAPAGRFVQAVAAYPAGRALADVLAAGISEVSGDVDPAELARAIAPLHDLSRGARADIVYAQLGGLDPQGDPSTASVMVVCSQGFGTDTVTRTVDVRVALVDGTWSVVRVASAGGDPVARPDGLSDAAATVLDDPRITLPDSARWDIHRGDVEESLLQTMVEMAAMHPYAVACLSSGHPQNVFATDRTSNHTLGRAVDVWMVADVPVALAQPDRDTAVYDMNHRLFDAPDVQVGGPWRFEGARSFTDPVHLDHLHVAADA